MLLQRLLLSLYQNKPNSIHMSVAFVSVIAGVNAVAVNPGSVIKDKSGYWVSLNIVGHPRWKKLRAHHSRGAKKEAATVTSNHALVVAHQGDVLARAGMHVSAVIPLQGNCTSVAVCKKHVLSVMQHEWGEYSEDSSEVLTWCRLVDIKAQAATQKDTIMLTGRLQLRYANTHVALKALTCIMNHLLDQSGLHFPYQSNGCDVTFSAALLIRWNSGSKLIYSQTLAEFEQWKVKQTDLIY